MSRGFVSPGVMVGSAFIVEGMSVTPEACTLEWDRFGGGGSVMVWGGVSQHHRTELAVIAGNLNAVRYREDILLPHVVPFLQAHPDMTLQHDNATSNTAHSVHD
uniref:SJCHGC04882 protein n=1 Tax=Schistosoma japonicum TaxID=6182 RepID=Q5DG26_SCHJA|nr:SJCHGC04882 protein [Schistosoma japonicum]